MAVSRIRILLCFLALLPFAGCSCSGDPCSSLSNNQPDHPGACTSSTECGDHYACSPNPGDSSQSCCLFADRACNTEADCCPGQTCPSDQKKCFDRVLECASDVDCGDQGDRFCETYTDSYGTTSRCRTHACAADGSCPSGQSCFEGVCLAGLPCGGSCPAGEACVVDTDKCQSFSCPASCEVGFIAAFHDQTNIWDSCNKPEVSCECAELPPLRSDDLGRHSAIAADPADGQLVVSSYDGQYGDLVVSRFDATGKLAKQEYVDGVPSSGQVQYAPSGPRGGITAPGDDVGRFTDIAASASGELYVSYYDQTHGDLKLAYQPRGGGWTSLTVDGTNADLGQYTSVAIDANGLPGIAYFQHGGDAGFDASSCPAPVPTGPVGYITALKLARATKAHPGPADFTIQTLACLSRPPPPCEGCAGVCADTGSGPACYQGSTSCSACDPTTQVCVDASGTPTCAAKYDPSQVQGLDDGVGLFAALAFKGTDAYLVYMQRTSGKGSLYGLHVTGAGAADAPFLIDGSGDAGYFPDVKLAPGGQVAVSYEDLGHHALKFYFGDGFVPTGTFETVDDGVAAAGSGDVSYVGGDSAIAFSPSGVTYLAYQNSTRGDLALARRTSAWEKLAPLRTQGAVGFFADGAMLQGSLFVSHAQLHAKTVNGIPTVDNQLLVDHVSAP